MGVGFARGWWASLRSTHPTRSTHPKRLQPGDTSMTWFDQFKQTITRRHFFQLGSHAVGWAALASLLDGEKARGNSVAGGIRPGAVPTHHAPKAKQVIYLHMVGGPPQMDLYDYKPVMRQWYDRDLPDSIRMGQRLTTMTSGQARFPVAPSKFRFARHGQSG